MGDRVFTATGGTALIAGTSHVQCRDVRKISFSDRQTIRCGPGQEFDAQSPAQRVRDGKPGEGGRARRRRLTEDRDAFATLAGQSAPGELITVPDLRRLTGIEATPLLETLSAAGVVRTRVRRRIISDQVRRRSMMVNTYPALAVLNVIVGCGFGDSIPKQDLPERMSVREAFEALGAEQSSKAADSVRGALKRRHLSVERSRREVLDGALSWMTSVHVFNRREALLAVASQRNTILDRLPKRVTRVTATSIEASLRDQQRSSRLTWSVETPEPFDLPDRDVRIPPWLLGFWLGDGDHDNYQVTVGNGDRDALVPMIERIWGGPLWIRELEGKIKVSLRTRDPGSCFQGHPRVDSGPCYTCLTLYEYRGLRRPRPGINAPFIRLLRHARVLKNKHVPAVYLRASSSQRLATLQGLIDSDGHVAEDGGVELALSDPQLASDSLELIRSLGIRASCSEAPTHRTTSNGAQIPGKNRHRIHFTTSRRVASLPRKADRLLAGEATVHAAQRIFVTSVAHTQETTKLVALTIDDPARTFLVEGFLPVLDDSQRGHSVNPSEA